MVLSRTKSDADPFSQNLVENTAIECDREDQHAAAVLFKRLRIQVKRYVQISTKTLYFYQETL